MSRDIARRVDALESRQPDKRLRRLGPPTYAVIREGEPRPDVDGPVYVLVTK